MSEYLPDGSYDDALGGDDVWTDDDTATLAEMEQHYAAAQEAGQAAFDERLAAYEEQQALADEQRAAEYEAADAAEANQETVNTLFIEAGEKAGIRSEAEMEQAIAVAEGLMSDRDFRHAHPDDGIETVKAAIKRAMDLVVPEDEGDEIDTAVRVMTRRRAERAYHEGGSPSRDLQRADERLELLAEQYGVPKAVARGLTQLPLNEKAELWEALTSGDFSSVSRRAAGQMRDANGRFV